MSGCGGIGGAPGVRAFGAQDRKARSGARSAVALAACGIPVKVALPRPLLHASTALLLAALLDSWRLFRGVLVATGIAAVLFEAARLHWPAVAAWAARTVPVFRPGEGRKPSGAGWLFLGYALAAWFPPPAPAAAVLAGALADPAAAVIGRRFGAAGARKSWPGTATAFLVAAAAVWVWGAAPPAGLLAGAVAAALERWPGPFDDNLLVAPGVGLVVWWLV